MISSTSNAQVKQAAALNRKAKYRKETGLFVAEGLRMFQEIPTDRIQTVYVSESFMSRKEHKRMLEGVRKVELVSDEVLKAMSDTQTPQGILALVKQYTYGVEEILTRPGSAHLMILDTIQDPGNLGTILRAGEGAGVTGVIMNNATADIYNPKVIRSTMGSVCRVPFAYVEDLKTTLEQLKQNKIHLYAAHLEGKRSYDQEDYLGHTGFLIGNEANGLSDEIAAMADTYIKIPMLGQVESLNAAVAASVLMFEAARQRRNAALS